MVIKVPFHLVDIPFSRSSLSSATPCVRVHALVMP